MTRLARAGAVVPGVERLAVVHASGLGDLIGALPAIDALRAAYPNAEIVLCARRWHRELLTSRPSPVHRVEVVPGPLAVKPENEAFLAARTEERFDLAVQLHGGGRESNPFTRALSARVTAGARTHDAAPLDLNTRYEHWQHETIRWLEVVSLVGAAPERLEPCLAVTDADRREACRALPAGDRPLAVLHPGASDGRRRWPPEKFARVGDRLAANGLHVAIVGTGDEADLAGSVTRAMAADASDLSGRLTVGGLAGLLERAEVLVANDSGPRHLAAAVGTPTVGVYWCGNLINAGALTRDRHRQVLSWTLECPRCGTNCMTGECPHRDSFVAGVAVEDVVAQALDLIEARDEERPAVAGRAEM